MTDLERIKHIEQILGFKLNRVSLEDLFTKGSFLATAVYPFALADLQDPRFFWNGVRNFSIDSRGELTGLALDFCGLFVLDDNYLGNFKNLKKLKLRNSFQTDYGFLAKLGKLQELELSGTDLSDVSFLKDLTSLTSLDLRNTQLTDVSFLKDLTGLTSLDLSGTQLTDFSFLKDLTGLTSISLSSNQLSDVSFLKDLTGLTSISLSSNQLSDVSFLKDLTGLTSISLSSNQLSDVSFLKDLTGLTSLDLSGTQLSDVSFLKDLTGLTSLDLSGTQLSDVSFLKDLTGLTSLDLSGNQLSDVSFFKELTGLTSLDLSGTQLSDVSFLKELTGLTSLYLSRNELSDVSFLKELTGLTSLDLRNTQLSDVSFLKDLTGLTSLDLSYNQLSDVSFLKELTGLTSLYLSRNELSDVSFLKELTGLTSLDLRNTQLSDVSFLKDLTGLTSLDLSYNQLSDVSFLKELTGLTSLDLSDNKITQIEPLIHLPNLAEISLTRNKIIDCPPDVWQSDEIQQIRAYFEGRSRDAGQKQKPKTRKATKKTAEIEQESVSFESIAPEPPAPEIDDVKLIFVGNSGSGKTQLSKYFETGKLDKTRETTHGIRLKRWLPGGKASAAFDSLEDRVAVNIWDFGGQEYYHGTFRLFLSNYAVYVLLWESDTNQNDVISTEVQENLKEDLQHYHYKYWLDNIRHYAPTSPILIVQNKVDKDERQRVDTLWIEDYRVFGDHYISLYGAAEGTSAPQKWGFDLFCNDLGASFKNILDDEAQQRKSIAWLKVRDAVIDVIKPGKKSGNNPFAPHLQRGKYIHLKDFEKACLEIEAELSPDEIYTLPRWLHNSGLVIYFGEDAQLRDKVYLDPVWVTEGIYDVLNNTVRAANGEFSTQEMKSPKKFPKETVLALMRQMEIIFEKTDQPDTFVAPQYLPDTHPVEDLYAIAAKGLRQKAYSVRLPLYFFRKVLQRMIFFYGMSQNVDARYYWKKGILFKKHGTRVMFKGIMPEADSESGILLIGAEPVGEYRRIQKEVFHIIAEILEEKELSRITNRPGPESKMRAQKMSGSFGGDIYHRPENWTKRFETQEEAPRWLRQMEVSVDGENFANYLELCRANRNDEIYIQSDLGKRLRIHDFELLLDKEPQRPLKVFFSYSHKDTEIMNQLSVHLAPLKRMEKIEVWSDKAIQPGDEWDAAINDNLRDSDIILFLVSADFIASSYIWEEEIPLALELRDDPNERVSRVIPIYLRPFDFSGLDFSDLEMLPKDPQTEQLKAISQWDNFDEAFMEIARAIREVIKATV